MKTHGFCLTINNPQEEDWLLLDGYDDHLRNLGIVKPNLFDNQKDFKGHYSQLQKLRIQYIIYGIEKGKKGTRHLQMFVCFRRTTSFNTVKKIWPRAHIEHTRGTFAQAREYCQKSGNFREYGYDLDSCRDNIERDIYLQNSASEESDLRADVASLRKEQGLILERLEANNVAINTLIDALTSYMAKNQIDSKGEREEGGKGVGEIEV